MPTYLDLTRTSNQGCAFAFNLKNRFQDPAWSAPPGFYEFTKTVDFTVGGHYGCSARFETLYVTTPSATVPSVLPWTWAIKIRVTVTNGHGASVTQDAVIDSGSFAPGVQNYYDVTAAVSGNFSFTCPTAIYYDVTESQPDVLTYTHPPYTVYNQYERSVIGGTAVTTATVNGITTTATSTIATVQPTSYQFTFTGTNTCVGALAGVLDLLVSACVTNSVAIPSYSYLHFISADLFVNQSTSIQLRNIGTDDAFGDPATTSAVLTSAVALKRNMRMMGKINAFDISYPTVLSVVLTGFDTTNRTITPTGNYEELHTINHYSFASTLTVGGTPANQSASANNIPAKFKSEILPASLTAAGDDIKATRLPFRGWNFIGVSMSLATETQILAGGTSNNRAFSPTENFNGYRYLDVEVKSLSGLTESSSLTFLAQPNTDTKQWSFTTGSATYEFKRIDLLCPPNKTSNIDTQDDPYPRLNPSNPTAFPGQEVQNSDYYGLTRVSNMTVGNANVQLNRVYLRCNADSVKSTFVSSFNYGLSNFRKYQTDAIISGTTYSYYGRRLWQVSVEGRNEEEFDIYYRSSTGGSTWFPLTITDFVGRVLANQRGWSCSASTPAGSGMTAYANSATGYAVWLGGLTFKADTGGGAIQKDWISVTQNAGSPDCDVLAQTYFDEINGNMIPDYVDPFGVYKSDTHITLPSAAILRGHAHGNLFKDDNLPKLAGTVVYTITSTSASRGSGTSAANGEYQTGAPKGLPTQGHTVTHTSFASNITETYTAKRWRRTFRDSPVSSDIVAADVAGDQTITLAVGTGGVLQLWFTGDATPSNWYTVSTGLTNVQKCDICYSKTDSEQKIICVAQVPTNQIYRYETVIQGTLSMATLIADGTLPAVTTNPMGTEYIAYRNTAGALVVAKRDAQGNALGTTTAVASITAQEFDIWWRLDTLYIVYRATAGLTVITSTDDGDTWT